MRLAYPTRYKKEKGYVKGVNAQKLPIEGEGVAPIHPGQWRGEANITIAPIDDHKSNLGIDFLDMVKAFLVPYANTIVHYGEWPAMCCSHKERDWGGSYYYYYYYYRFDLRRIAFPYSYSLIV